MLMTVISLAISLVSTSNLYTPQQQTNPTHTAQSNRLQRENDSKRPAIVPHLPLTVPVEPIALPAGDTAWTIQIVSRGGLTGAGRGDLTVASDGMLTWSGADGSCYRKLTDEAIHAIASAVAAANIPAASIEPTRSSLCGDCYLTTMIVQRRGTEGISATTVYWDDATQSTVSADKFTVYEAAMAHKGCKLQ